ncbi:unnamed protein product, partial [Gongylonema pulchrum]|uniref:AH domain-containing protein n=1 Tax=Gongylonema pulchrum TaxID=637853 RepID=A0A183D0Y2_9BILA
MVKTELKGAYIASIREEYKTRGQDSVLMSEQLRDIVQRVNGEAEHCGKVQEIKEACKKNDSMALEKALKGVEGARKEFITYYLEALRNTEFSTIADIRTILQLTSEEAVRVETRRKQVNDIQTACQNNDPGQLANALKVFASVREDLITHYLKALKKAQIMTIEDVQTVILH